MAEIESNIPDVVPPALGRSMSTEQRLSIAQNVHRRYKSVADYVSELGGDKARVIEKVLIANNGVAAVKAIRSMRRWAYEVFGDEHAIQFVVMATPEDLRANAEYIRMGDVIVDVPGGANNHNYANVTLIVEIARLHRVNAVWAGWGHASENPALPNALNGSSPPIKFIGPAGPPMAALGDKIGSTIIAQTAGVSCIAWNGSKVFAEYDKETGSLPEKAFQDACVTTATQAEEAAAEIGFPIMIKASEGGGGKGIRRVDKAEDVANAYRQVCGEVPGSPIFIMKLSKDSRHLEVQVLADEYGDAIALNGRDCSVQRRHQKIIEEGPPVAAKPEVWLQMERAAVALAKAVHYSNAGTVEYLYSEKEAKFYFLELNPRLQVEHPVTEMITKVNLPACQLQVAMGIPLHNIPEIRELYGKNRFEEEPNQKIDFAANPVRPAGHCMAVRITAENAEAGFKPTSGGIQELNFRSTPNVWGYFSMDSSGSIHEFADSQFGHLFANGKDREQARRNMVLALKELSIRGDISTTVDYISTLIELEDFVHNKIDTSWLDGIIKAGPSGPISKPTSVPTLTRNDHVHVVLGATVVAFDLSSEGEKAFCELLAKGQLPSRALLTTEHDVELILSGIKYKLHVTRTGPNRFSIAVGGNDSVGVSTTVRVLSDGGYLIDISGQSHVAYLTGKGDAATGMKLNVAGATIKFSADYDPSTLRTEVAGKLVKKLKLDGEHAKKGEPYCEIEVMKMFMPLKVEESGIVHWCSNEGAALAAGDVLASLQLDNPENVATVTVFEGDLDVRGWGERRQNVDTSRPHLLIREAMEMLDGAMSGFKVSVDDIDKAVENLGLAVREPMLPVFEIQEQLSVLSGRIPSPLYAGISDILSHFKSTCAAMNGGAKPRFPAEDVVTLLDKASDGFQDASERATFGALTAPLRNFVIPYTKSKLSTVPGSERALQSFLSILRKWVSVERWFCDGKTYADALDGLRQANKTDYAAVLEVCRAHEQLEETTKIIFHIMSALADATLVDGDGGAGGSAVMGAGSLPLAMPALSEIGSMGSKEKYAEVALRARLLLVQESKPNVEQRKAKVLSAVKTMSADHTSRDAEEILEEHTPVLDVFFSLIGSLESPREEVGLMELYMRHLYRSYTFKDCDRDSKKRLIKFSFYNKPAEGAINSSMSVTSMNDLTRAVSTGSLSGVGQESDMMSNAGMSTVLEKIPRTAMRTGACAIVDKIEDLYDKERFESFLNQFPQYSDNGPKIEETGPINVLYLIVLESKAGPGESAGDATADLCATLLKPYKAMLKQADIRRVSFVFDQVPEDQHQDVIPSLFTFRCPEFKEDSLFRRIDPSNAMHLDLTRVVANFRAKSLGSRHTSACHVHLYEATPKSSAMAKDKKASKVPRVFARALSFVLDFSASSFERILVDALNAMDLCSLKSRADNHLFLNLVSDVEKAVLDPVVVEQVVVAVLKRHTERINNLGIAEVETRVVCCLDADSPPIAIRLFASNPSGYVHVMNTYVEASNGSERIFKLVGGTKASVAGGDSFWDGKSIDMAYPLTRPFDAQRKAAAKSSDTLYCYDIPALFEAAVEQQWQEAAERGGVDGGIRAAARPLMVMYTTELVVQKAGSPSNAWTMDDYLKGDLELVPVHRGAGANDVGMVAWLMNLKTVEYPNGRQIVLIANDITFKAGSFGTREDVVFKLASEFARKKRVPRLYIAANSGARIGLADGVKKAFKVAFKDTSRPDSGFDFLYVTEIDYEAMTSNGKNELIAEPAEYDGQRVYKITDIIGSEPDLGVENLKGSGLIAGETSVAYDDIFTLTVVLGRTVGIGAYLVRLGQRTIQKYSQSPIILTGYQALNKLMGVDVYSTNDQLGGPGIMHPNGVSHIVEHDHLQSVKAAIDWLSYVPSERGGLLPVTDIRGLDDIERSIDFMPSPGVPYDPRQLLAGGEDRDGQWLSGFFDRGSFMESMSGWAKAVVVGRARLGGIPMGVIVTENRTVTNIKPADPADVTASETVIQEAGCVWFPNSAYKTAQAIKDFRTEDLPLIVFANWRGFSGGQRDMFDEVLKYGSMIVDAFVAYEQPVFVFIPPFAEIRGGAWVVLDASINPSVMEMYATKDSARGGVLEANGAASVKYRTKELLATMHRLDDKLKALDEQLAASEYEDDNIAKQIKDRENMLLPVYEQISVKFCELHDTPGRMKAVGVIQKEVEWKQARSFFYWRLRRKLAEFDLRKQLVEAGEVGRSVSGLTSLAATNLIKSWFVGSPGMTPETWDDDKIVLSWMAGNYGVLEQQIAAYSKHAVVEEVVHVMTAGGTTSRIGVAGIVEGLSKAMEKMSSEDQDAVKQMLSQVIG